MNIRSSIAVIKFSFCNYFAAQTVQISFPRKYIILVWHILINFSTVFLEIHAANTKSPSAAAKKRLMESLVSGSF